MKHVYPIIKTSLRRGWQADAAIHDGHPFSRLRRYARNSVVMAGLLALTALPAHAAERPLPWKAENEAQQTSLQQVQRYLAQMTSLKADFTQIAPDGSLASGVFFLKRPGKMRWQYAPPVPVLMLSNGDFVTYIDYELDQVSHVPIDDSLAGFFAKPRLRFDDPAIMLTNFHAEEGVLIATLVQADDPEDGQLTLEFSSDPIQLSQITMVDKVGQATRISLQDVQTNLPLDDELFIFKDPRTKPRIRR